MADPMDIERDLKEVSKLAKQDRYTEALRLGMELAARYPQSAEVHRELGYVHALKKDFDGATRRSHRR